MRPKLKLNHISTLHDARYCSAVGVELLGFCLTPDQDHYMAPASISEIMEWLSGPESVGEFLYEAPDELLKTAKEAKLNWVSVPLDYPTPTATEITVPLIFRSATLSAEVIDRLAELGAAFPQARFEFPVSREDADLWKELPTEILERSILRCASPDPIYEVLKREGIKPFAFSLGDFVEEPDGLIDYESCDDFIEEYHSLAI